MPMLVKLLLAVGLVAGVAWGGMYWLANAVEPTERDMVVRIPADKLTPK